MNGPKARVRGGLWSCGETIQPVADLRVASLRAQ
jgi:hypothetical protein